MKELNITYANGSLAASRLASGHVLLYDESGGGANLGGFDPLGVGSLQDRSGKPLLSLTHFGGVKTASGGGIESGWHWDKRAGKPGGPHAPVTCSVGSSLSVTVTNRFDVKVSIATGGKQRIFVLNVGAPNTAVSGTYLDRCDRDMATGRLVLPSGSAPTLVARQDLLALNPAAARVLLAQEQGWALPRLVRPFRPVSPLPDSPLSSPRRERRPVS